MLGFLSQLDLKAAERLVKLEPKVCNCSQCGREQRARDVQRVKGRPVCAECASDRWSTLLASYANQG
jgi:formylmethanofuran dehydrogenase subunit E